MTGETSLQLPGFEDQTKDRLTDSETVKTVRALISEIEDANRMTARLRVYCSQALKYAAIMDQPKSAVAAVQAGVQLTTLIEEHLAEQQESEGTAIAALVELLEGDPFA